MANVLGTLFQDIANAIRGKTGETGTMKPNTFPAAISAIKTGSNMGAIDDLLDEINGEVIGETQYTVTFIGAEGETLGQMQVYERDNCPNPVSAGVFSEPTKASTKYDDYHFKGWSLTEGGSATSLALVNITADRIVYAAFYSTRIILDGGSLISSDPLIDYEVYWELDPDYVLTLYGTGRPYIEPWGGSYNENEVPWHKYRGQITKAVVADGVTRVPDYMCSNCPNLETVELGNIVQDIGISAFEGSTAIKNVVIPDSTRFFSGSAFENCSGLESINIPDRLYAINAHCFGGCTSLTSVTFARTSGWVHNGTDAIPESDISNPATAAVYLTTTYIAKWENESARG